MSGARSQVEANQVARSVCGSQLTKAAIFGHDPNWGRIAAAAGYAGVDFQQEDLSVRLGSHVLMETGQPTEFDRQAASDYLKVRHLLGFYWAQWPHNINHTSHDISAWQFAHVTCYSSLSHGGRHTTGVSCWRAIFPAIVGGQ